jgi:hypothetical protein
MKADPQPPSFDTHSDRDDRAKLLKTTSSSRFPAFFSLFADSMRQPGGAIGQKWMGGGAWRDAGSSRVVEGFALVQFTSFIVHHTVEDLLTGSKSAVLTAQSLS